MEIPYDRLPPATLRALLLDFVTRDGTDYGAQEVDREKKVQQVEAQLRSGKIGIVFDAESESFDILTREQIKKRVSSPDETA